MLQINNKNIKVENNILMIGNGFDIALGMKTQYSDFLIVIVLMVALNNYKYLFDEKDLTSLINQHKDNFEKEKNNLLAERLKDPRNKYDSDTLKKEIDEKYNNTCFNPIYIYYATELLKEYKTNEDFYYNFFCKIKDYHKTRKNYSPKDKLKNDSVLLFPFLLKSFLGINMYQNIIINEKSLHYGEDNRVEIVEKVDNIDDLTRIYYGFEDEYIDEENNYYDEQRLYSFKLKDKLTTLLHFIYNSIQSNKKIAGWLDVEKIIEMHVSGDKILRNRFNYNGQSLSSDYTLSDIYYDNLNFFCNLFIRYLSLLKNNDVKEKLDGITKKYSKIYNEFFNENSIQLNILKSSIIYNFNYTNFFSNEFNKAQLFFINGQAFKNDENSTLNKNENEIVFGYSRTTPTLPNNNCLLLEKDKQRIAKGLKITNYSQHISKKFNLLIFGHSCSAADSDIIKPLLTSSNLNYAVICCYDKKALASIYTNLVQIIDGNNSELTVNKLISDGKLFFTVNNDNIK